MINMFKLTQIESDHYLYLYPESDGCNIELTKYGDTDNWKCVDDNKDLPDDDVTYVESHATDLKYDLYNLENTSQTGTIEYVQIVTRTKSHLQPQLEDGIFKIIMTDDNCSNIYKSDDLDLTTSYQIYNILYTINPSSSTDWTWTDINNLQIGIECNSPIIYAVNLNLTLRPNADDYRLYTWYKFPNIDAFYDKVDEEISNEDTDYVHTPLTLEEDDRMLTFEFPNHTTETGTINYITTVWRMKRTKENITYCRVKSLLRINGTKYKGNSNTPTLSYETYNKTWNTNPDTGMAWTWNDIDNLKCGLAVDALGNGSLRVTQYYVIVNYTTPEINPEIRTTQVYAVVKYTTSSECYLQNPEEITMDETQIVKSINMWKGTRVIYGEKRGNHTMLLTGKEWDTDTINAEDRIDCIKNMAKLPQEIIIDIQGLSSKVFDGKFRLASFGWKKLSECPKVYEWMLELESVI